MARGHATVKRDPDAQAELRARHGIINADIATGNAEALIRAHAASQSRAVSKASLLPINNEATAELDLDDLQSQLGGDTVQAAAVRGNAIVIVAEDENGRTYKTVLPANDRYVAPEEDTKDVYARETSKAELELQAEVAKLQAEHAAEIEKLRQEQNEKLQTEIEKIREEIFGAAHKRAEEAAEASETDAGTDDGSKGVDNDPSQGGGAKTRSSRSSKGSTKKS